MQSRKQISHLLVALTTLTFIAGCTNPNTANEENFEAAVRSYLKTKYPSCYFHANYPKQIGIFDDKTKFDALVEAGMLKASVEKTSADRTSEEKIYTLTPEGEKYYTKDADKLRKGGDLGAFCIGTVDSIKITQFTEPSDLLGSKSSNVKFQYSVKDIPSWANNEKILNSEKRLAADVKSASTPISGTQRFVLTNKGWVHHRDMRD
jgi:DNA-binding PadR family transcriptional regulator